MILLVNHFFMAGDIRLYTIFVQLVEYLWWAKLLREKTERKADKETVNRMDDAKHMLLPSNHAYAVSHIVNKKL